MSERPGVGQCLIEQRQRSIDEGAPLLDVRKTLDEPFLQSRMPTDGYLSTWSSHLFGLPLGYRLVHCPQPDIKIWYALQRCKEFLFSRWGVRQSADHHGESMRPRDYLNLFTQVGANGVECHSRLKLGIKKLCRRRHSRCHTYDFRPERRTRRNYRPPWPRTIPRS